jgi:O-antigen/teichoic acid export membrane protein
VKYLKQFSLYTFVGFFNAGLSFLLMPYLSFFIKPAGYGILSMINSLVTILIPLIGLTASGLITVEYYKIKDRSQFASLFSSIQAIPILPGLIFLLFCFLFQIPFADFLEIPRHKSYWVPLAVLIALFSIYYETLLSYHIIAQKAKLYVKYSLFRVLTEVALTLIFISIFKMEWEGRMLSWAVATLISFGFSFVYFRSEGLLTFRISKQFMYAGIVFGLPLILHTISKFIINQSDRLFITKMVPNGIAESGIYNIGYQVGMVILLLVNAVTAFFQPYLYERLSNLTEKAKIEIVKTTYIIISGLFIFLLLLTFLSPVLFKTFIHESYSKGNMYVFWTGLSYFLWGIYSLFSGYIFYKKKTRSLGYLAILNVVLNIALNYFLILEFGPLGAVYATCISFFVVALIVVAISTSLYKLPWFYFAGRSK